VLVLNYFKINNHLIYSCIESGKTSFGLLFFSERLMYLLIYIHLFLNRLPIKEQTRVEEILHRALKKERGEPIEDLVILPSESEENEEDEGTVYVKVNFLCHILNMYCLFTVTSSFLLVRS
jgi:hypothetical protein